MPGVFILPAPRGVPVVKRKDLAALSMRKYPATADAQRVLEHAADGLNVRNDGGHKGTINQKPEGFKTVKTER